VNAVGSQPRGEAEVGADQEKKPGAGGFSAEPKRLFFEVRPSKSARDHAASRGQALKNRCRIRRSLRIGHEKQGWSPRLALCRAPPPL
jgi:hypothetical protein